MAGSTLRREYLDRMLILTTLDPAPTTGDPAERRTG